MLFPPELGIKSHTKLFSCVGIWNFCAIDEDWLLFNLVVCEVTDKVTIRFYEELECGFDKFLKHHTKILLG
jgi:hypothetical protein